MESRLTSRLWQSSCLRLPSAGKAGVHHKSFLCLLHHLPSFLSFFMETPNKRQAALSPLPSAPLLPSFPPPLLSSSPSQRPSSLAEPGGRNSTVCMAVTEGPLDRGPMAVTRPYNQGGGPAACLQPLYASAFYFPSPCTQRSYKRQRSPWRPERSTDR